MVRRRLRRGEVRPDGPAAQLPARPAAKSRVRVRPHDPARNSGGESRIRCDLSVEKPNHLIDETPLLDVKRDATTNRLVGPTTRAATILVKLLRHGGPVANHFD